jgi:hypothetical protein
MLPAAPSEDARATPPAAASGLHKFLFVVWLVSCALFGLVLAYIFINGDTPDRISLSRDIGTVWGGLGAYLIWPEWKAWKSAVSPPYRGFIYSLVCFVAVAASGVFLLASATAQGSPNAFSQNSVSLVGLIATAIWASRSWSSITRAEPETDPAFRQKHRAFGLKAGAVITCALVGVTAGGVYFGLRAARTAKVETLLKEVEALGLDGAPKKQRFMQLVRAKNDAQNLSEYLQRCTELELATDDYEAAERQLDTPLGQLQQEIAQLRPESSFASVLPVVTVMRAVLGKDLEGAEVYRKEIGYAKQLPGIPEADRVRFFNANIQPVIEQEAEIAKNEIEILKDAKARGVTLPEEMSREAGID